MKAQLPRRSPGNYCRGCGRPIPMDLVAKAYALSVLLRCSECGTYTSAVTIGNVAGELVEVEVDCGDGQFVSVLTEVL